MTDRYSRQIKFIGKSAQKSIESSTVAIIGCGALGSNSAEILTRAGIKKITLIDFDKVELSNLQRQTTYTEQDINSQKVFALAEHLRQINSNVEIIIANEKLTEKNIEILKSDIIIDGTDNFETRYIINKYAKENNIPYIFGSTIRSEGMIYPVIKDHPCYKCIFPNNTTFEKADTQGVIASAVKTTSSIQCSLAMQILTKQKITPQLIKFNLYNQEFLKIKPKINPKCDICNK